MMGYEESYIFERRWSWRLEVLREMWVRFWEGLGQMSINNNTLSRIKFRIQGLKKMKRVTLLFTPFTSWKAWRKKRVSLILVNHKFISKQQWQLELSKSFKQSV